MAKTWDVIVVGGGPGGALAAKKCAEKGLETLLLEKKKMPRDKCCSGMVMGPWGQQIIEKEFGEYPPEVMTETEHLLGYAIHIPGVPAQTYDVKTPATWRKFLDTWLCKGALDAGAEVWDGTRVTAVSPTDMQYSLTVEQDGSSFALTSSFLIGADGAYSAVRRALFPDFKPTLLAGYRECYEARIDLPERRFNIFTALGKAPMFFVHHKKQYMLLEGMATKGRLKEVITQAKQLLIDNYGLAPQSEPVWRDGCVEPLMSRELTAGTFLPALGNALVIGDAAGLNIPVSGEGLSTSLKSGLDAANAVIEAQSSGKMAGGIYMKKINELLEKFKDIQSFASCIKQAQLNQDPQAFSDAWLASWGYSLNL